MRRGRAARLRRHDLVRLQRPAIGARHRARPLRRALVGEALPEHRRRGLGVLGGAEVAERAQALALAEALLERVGDLRPRELLAAALAEDAADQRRRGDQVGLLPGLRALRMAERRVLAGQLRRVELGLVDVGVDAGDVVADVALDLLAVGAEEVRQLGRLALEVGLRVGRDLPLLGVHRRVGAAREVGQLGPARVAQDVHEEQPVLRGRVARPEHGAVARGAVDVRHAEAAVAHDRDVPARGVGPLGLAVGHAEARVLEVVRQLLGGQPRRGVHQVAVHAELVAAVRHRRARGEEGRQLGAVVAPARAGREDVAEALAVVGLVGLGARALRWQAGDDGGHDRRDRQRDLRCGGGGGQEEAATATIAASRVRGSMALPRVPLNDARSVSGDES